MSRALQTFNFPGICAVVIVCVIQWRSIARIDSDRDRLESVRLSQGRQIGQQTKTISDQASDLEDFRRRLTQGESQLKQMQLKLSDALTDRDQLREALPKWKAAVAARDETIKLASTQIESLAKQRDAVVAQFNEVASKLNDIVRKLAQ